MRGEHVTLVLSGGGAKAAAHLGAWQALVAAGIHPAHVVATSMGAVLAAAIGAGLDPEAIIAQFPTIGARGVAPRSFVAVRGIFAPSLLRPEPLREAIDALLPARRFEELAFPLTVTAVDLDTGALVLYGAGGEDAPLLDVLLAACALPIYYPPVPVGNRARMADGGLRGVVPLAAAAAIPSDHVIAVDIGPGFDEEPQATPGRPPLVQLNNDASGITMASHTLLEIALWRATPGRPPLTVVRPKVERHATFNVQAAPRYAELGREAMRAALAGVTGERTGT